MRRRRYRATRPQILDNNGSGAFFTLPDGVLGASAFVMELRMIMSDWTPSSNRIIAEHGTVDGNIGWNLEMTPTGALRFSWFPTGLLASRVAITSPVPSPDFINNDPAIIQFGVLADLFGVASAAQFNFGHGERIDQYGALQTGALATPVFNSTATINIGSGAGVESILSFTAWEDTFINQLTTFPGGRPITLGGLHDIGLLDPNDTDWLDQYGNLFTLSAAAIEPFKYPRPYAA